VLAELVAFCREHDGKFMLWRESSFGNLLRLRLTARRGNLVDSVDSAWPETQQELVSAEVRRLMTLLKAQQKAAASATKC